MADLPDVTSIVTETPVVTTVRLPSTSSQATVIRTITTAPDASQSTTSAIPTPPSSGGGLSSGVVAGVAIGCIIAGIAIGAIVALYFMRRRARPGPEETQYMLGSTGHDLKDPAAAAAAADPFRLDQILSEPIPDDMIAHDLRGLSLLVQQHVVENYHHELVPVDQSALGRALHDLGFGNDSAIPPSQLVMLAVSPQGRPTALQHIIMRALTSNVVLSSTARYSLLPSSMSSFMREVAPTERDRSSAKAVSAAFARWRQVTTFLINPNRSERAPLSPTESLTGPKARELVAALNSFLSPFIDPNQVEPHQQAADLHRVAMEAARFGYTLISQPGEFRLRWDAGPAAHVVGAHVVVVCPGLDKISDEHGTRYSPSQALLSPVTEVVR